MGNRKILKTGDFLLILIVFGLTAFLFIRFFFLKPAGKQVKITGKSTQNYYPADENKIIDVEGLLGITKVVIEDGEIWIEDSPCREKLCIKMGRIKRTHEQLVCIPNRVVVELEGEGGAVDGVSR